MTAVSLQRDPGDAKLPAFAAAGLAAAFLPCPFTGTRR
jgi:hypothetical protein